MILDNTYAAFVNLDHRKDRLQHMERQLARIGVDAERVRGMLPSEYQGDPKRVEVMKNRTPGAIGCYFSQVSVMMRAFAEGLHAFVMEDDLVFCQDFRKRIEHIDQFCETHTWDVIWLGGTFHINPPYWHKKLGRDAERTDDDRMMRTFGAFSTHAYIVNAGSIARILSMLDKLLDQTIGIDWSFIQLQPEKLRTFAFVPGCVIQMDNQSDIGRGITRFSGFAKLGPYWYQEFMEDFDPNNFNWHEAGLL